MWFIFLRSFWFFCGIFVIILERRVKCWRMFTVMLWRERWMGIGIEVCENFFFIFYNFIGLSRENERIIYWLIYLNIFMESFIFC